MTIEETKTWLRSYRYLLKESERIGEELEYWRSKSERMTREMSGQPSGSGSCDKVSASVEKILEIEEKLSQKHADLVEQKTQIEAAIDSLPDDTCRLILKLKYINGNTWEQIAVKLDCTYRWVLYLHGRALQSFVKSSL